MADTEMVVEETMLSKDQRLKMNHQMSVLGSKARIAEAMVMRNAISTRSDLLRQMLNPGKDINHECGYPDTIALKDYEEYYAREGLGTKVVDFLPDEAWAMNPEITENSEADETTFEKEWKTIEKDFRIYHFLRRIDQLSGIGQFGVLLLGLSDGKELSEPVEGIDEVTGKPTSSKNYELLFLKPFSQSAIAIKLKEMNTSSPRFGYPVKYEIKFEDIDSLSTGANSKLSSTKEVHWTRIIHVADNRSKSEVFGTPRMQPVYNRLLDVRKILSGSGEMFWKGAFPGYAFEVNPDQVDAAMDTDTIKEEMAAYSANLQRYIALQGVKVTSLDVQAASPKEHLQAQIQYIAIVLDVPYRVFIGTEEAKLASSQDMKTHNKRIMKRREDYVSPLVIRPLIDRFIAFGILPEVKEYEIDWPDLNTPSDAEQAEVAKNKTEALAKYVAGEVDQLIPPTEYLTMILKMSQDDAEAIEEAAMKRIKDEETFTQRTTPEPEPASRSTDDNATE